MPIDLVRETLESEKMIVIKDFCEKYDIKPNHLGADISDLKKKGMNIKTTKGAYEYFLNSSSITRAIKPQKFSYKTNEDLSTMDIYFEEDILNIASSGDWHCSTRKNFRDLRKILDFFREKNVYIFANGDLIQNETKNSVGDIYSQELSPDQQLEELIDIFHDYRDIIVAAFNGNHENRTRRGDGLYILKTACKSAQIPFIPTRTFGRLITPNSEKTYTCAHIASSAILKDSKRKGIHKKVEENYKLDIYFAAHSHDSVYDANRTRIEVDKPSGRHMINRQISLMNPALLPYFHGYGAFKSYSYPNMAMNYISICDDRMKVKNLFEERYIGQSVKEMIKEAKERREF